MSTMYLWMRVLVGISLLTWLLILAMNQTIELTAKEEPMINVQMPGISTISGGIVKEGEMMRILYWNAFRGFPNYSFGIGNAPFVQNGCKVSSLRSFK